jgi:Site-specific recombinase XerD
MNRFLLSKSIEGYLLSLGARHLSQNTIDDYARTFAKFTKFLGEDLPVTDITTRDIESFLAVQTTLSNKSLLNQYVGLSAFWTWMVNEEIARVHVVHKLKPPKAEQKEVVPFTEAEVKACMSALNKSRVYIRQGQSVDHSLASCDRNRAILLLMLDTGLRASELCDLKIEDVDNRNNRIFIKNGKGMKSRTLPFSPRTGQTLWRYLATRPDARPEDPLFISRLNRALTRTKLAEMCQGVGKRANVKGVHPHRFRHTFAIQYLKNGGNVYTLQAMLGHNSLSTVKIYLRLAQIDIDLVHRKASPVDGWRL